MVAPKIRLYNPTYQAKREPSALRPKQISDLKGKSVVILDNAWWIWEQTLPTLTEAFSKQYGVSKTTIYKVPRAGAPPPGVLEKAAKEGDCAILSLAYGGPEIVATLDNAIALAKAGLPTVCIAVDSYFWDKMARSRRVNLPVVIIPAMDPEGLPVEKAIELMEAAIPNIINGLKNPPKPQIEEPITEPFIEVPDSLDEIYNIMYQRDWTDGLPVIPPTEERVHKMLAHVHRDAEEVVGELPPLRGVATLGNIAANAVMAGCLPEYMPLLMAMVRACGEIDISLTNTLTGGAPVTPMTIINGPVRNELDINCSRGLLGPGRRSNATLGRALQFMLHNIGGATLRITMPDYMSNPGRYTFCFGENEEESPWESLHVERGFSRETSTVTITSVSSLIQNATYTYDWQTILTVLADSMAYFGCHTVIQGTGIVWVFITPEHANRLTSYGLSKKDVKEYIWEKARIPVSQFPEKLVPYPHKLLETNGQVRVVNSPDDVKIVVASGPGRYYALVMTGVPAPAGMDVLATAPIT